ncbi:MAG TPA: HAMP domain-containing sensor histidine kinase [Nitrososphaeraceae archaeon]|nr:HAMP domain-containing sensor histidine kinase [Nitrososphaeraceae archaeon]
MTVSSHTSPVKSNNGQKEKELTKVLYGVDTVINTVIQFLNRTDKIVYACVDQTRPILALDILALKKAFEDAKRRGVKLMYITEITKDNLPYCKHLMKMTHELRHLDGIKGNFYINETEYLAPATLHEKGKPASQIIYSNVNEIIEHQKYVFDSFWDRAIPAEQRIREIEEGVEAEFTKVITDGNRVAELIVEFAKSIKRETQVLLPNSNTIIMVDELDIWDYLIQAAKEKGADIRILCHMYDSNENADDIARHISSLAPSIRIFSTPSSEAILFIVDNEKFLRIEEKDTGIGTPTSTHVSDAINLAIYSNSKKGTASFKSIFDILWKQTDLYEQLKLHDKMQKEFINIASHEMKTPTQAIVGFSDLIQKHPEKREEMIQAILRNALRLQRLTNDILDVTRIDSQTLNLHKERFNIGDLIARVIEDYRSQIEKENQNVKLLYNFKQDTDDLLHIEADRDRITQVISNLLSNAVKFTSSKSKKGECGIISLTVERKNNYDANTSSYDNNQEEVIVSIKDTGEGINPEILPILFTKFATKSFSGTGLGLYISKSIVESHGGKMWAENNPDGKGATFTFTLPLSNRKYNQRLSERMTSNQT